MSAKKITATQLSLPKGGGAIHGIGETFQPDEFTGTASLSLPIPTSPCRALSRASASTTAPGPGTGYLA
jgi:hypothetical protein